MSLAADSNLQNYAFFYKGRLATVVSVNADTIVIDCNGVQSSVKRSELTTTPVFSFNQRLIENNEKKIAELRAKADNYTLQKINYRKDSKIYLAEMWTNCKKWGVSRYAKLEGEQYKTQQGLRKSFWSACMNAVNSHNGEYSSLRQIADLTFDNCRLQS